MMLRYPGVMICLLAYYFWGGTGWCTGCAGRDRISPLLTDASWRSGQILQVRLGSVQARLSNPQQLFLRTIHRSISLAAGPAA